MEANRAMEPGWYVLQAKPHHEPLVEAQLSSVVPEVFLPRIVATVRAGRHRQRRVVPMFPGYLFVRADVAQQGKAIRYTPGVKDFVRLAGAPELVAAEIVAMIRARTGPSGIFEPPPRRFAPGERLRIEDGPFRGLDAIFERELSAAGRVAVLLAEIELAARVILDRDQLTAA